jgi:hypothetical protein
VLEQVPDQARLAGTEKAGNDGSGYFQGHLLGFRVPIEANSNHEGGLTLGSAF